MKIIDDTLNQGVEKFDDIPPKTVFKHYHDSEEVMMKLVDVPGSSHNAVWLNTGKTFHQDINKYVYLPSATLTLKRD